MTGQPDFKLRDHQHLSYDLFAKQKGQKESYSYKLRSLFLRYQARDCVIPTHHAEMTYATFSLPVSREMRNKFAALLHQDNYSPFYEHIAREFQQACERTNLSISAMVANGASPIVRNSKIDKNDGNAELQKLSFDVTTNDPQFKCFYRASELEENLHFVIVAADKDRQASGYSKFMNQVEKALHYICDGLPINKERQGLTVRFYQHISYAI